MKLSDFYLIVSTAMKEEDVSKFNIVKFIKRAENVVAGEASIILNNPMQNENDETELPVKLYWILVVNAVFELMVISGNCVEAMKFREEYRKEKEYLKNN